MNSRASVVRTALIHDLKHQQTFFIQIIWTASISTGWRVCHEKRPHCPWVQVRTVQRRRILSQWKAPRRGATDGPGRLALNGGRSRSRHHVREFHRGVGETVLMTRLQIYEYFFRLLLSLFSGSRRWNCGGYKIRLLCLMASRRLTRHDKDSRGLYKCSSKSYLVANAPGL